MTGRVLVERCERFSQWPGENQKSDLGFFCAKVFDVFGKNESYFQLFPFLRLTFSTEIKLVHNLFVRSRNFRTLHNWFKNLHPLSLQKSKAFGVKKISTSWPHRRLSVRFQICRAGRPRQKWEMEPWGARCDNMRQAAGP